MRLLTILGLVLVVIALIGQGSALIYKKRDANNGKGTEPHNHSDESSSEEESSAEAGDITKPELQFLPPPKSGREAI